MRRLTAAGYDGDYDVELFGEEIDGADYVELIGHCRAAFERLLNLAVAE